MIVGLGGEAAGGRRHQIHDALDAVAANHLEDLVGIGHVHLRHLGARADLALEDVGDPARAVLREDDRLADLEGT